MRENEKQMTTGRCLCGDVTFVIDGRLFVVDRPHPRKECGLGLVKRVRERLREIGAA